VTVDEAENKIKFGCLNDVFRRKGRTECDGKISDIFG
jgi:hypothetical protein